MRYLTIANYLVVFSLWTAILAFYLRYRRITKDQDPLVATLLAVLALDALKSSVENAFFGIVWARNYGLAFPQLGEVLSRPGFLIAPKLLNTFVAVTVVVIIIRKWIPTELANRRTRERERARLIEELEHDRERWHLAVKATTDGIFDYDVHDDEVWVSDVYLETLGYAPGELAIRKRADLVQTIHREDRGRFNEYLTAAINDSDAPTELSVRQSAKSGEERSVVFHVCTVRAADGVARRVIGGRSDVTEREAAQATIAMQQRVESLGLLASGIAHDFNNLLFIMKVNAEVATKESRAGAAADLHEAIKRATELTARLLAYSGGGQATVGPVELREATSELIRLMRGSARTGVKLELDDGPPAQVVGDGVQLQQVVLNLVKNAIDSLGEGGGTVRVSIANEHVAEPNGGPLRVEPGDYVALTVSDTGSGMTEDVRRRMFEPLFTTKVHGHGLGLSAILGILRAHRGGIRVASELGVGTTITVLLPADAAPASVQPTARPRRALVVDDVPPLARSIARLVANLGYEVDSAGDGQEVVEKVEASHFDLVLLDVTLPDHNGVALYKKLRARFDDLPVILMSGSPLDEQFDDTHLAFLQKPFTAASMANCVRMVTQ